MLQKKKNILFMHSRIRPNSLRENQFPRGQCYTLSGYWNCPDAISLFVTILQRYMYLKCYSSTTFICIIFLFLNLETLIY